MSLKSEDLQLVVVNGLVVDCGLKVPVMHKQDEHIHKDDWKVSVQLTSEG